MAIVKTLHILVQEINSHFSS